jgi:DTW domain-containing protein
MKERCETCKSRPEACICPGFRTARPRTPVVIFQQARERRSFSGTGSLAHRVLEGTVLVPYGDPAQPLDLSPLEDPVLAPVVLYPSVNSRPLTADLAGCPPVGTRADHHRELCLIVLDGTWSQARKMAQRIPGLTALPFVRLPDDAASRFHLRKPPRPGYLGTAEALALALEILGEPGPAARLLEALEQVARHVLRVRGKIPRNGDSPPQKRGPQHNSWI